MGTEAKAGAQPDPVQQAIQFVVQQLKAGQDKMAIASKLQSMGLDVIESRKLVDTIHTEMMQMAQAQQMTSGSLVSGAVGGVLAAIVSGAVWALIVRLTKYEIGFMAWGLGVVVGAAVVMFARGRRGVGLQIVAVLASMFGIIVGKYMILVYLLHQMTLKEHGAQAAAAITYWSPKVMQFVISRLAAFASPYDALWIILAVVTAWKIPQGLGIRVPKRERGMIA